MAAWIGQVVVMMVLIGDAFLMGVSIGDAKRGKR